MYFFIWNQIKKIATHTCFESLQNVCVGCLYEFLTYLPIDALENFPNQRLKISHEKLHKN
jgi:hypothetical protein